MTGRIIAVDAASWSESYAYDSSGNLSSASGGGNQNRDTDGLREYAATTPRRAVRTHYEHDSAGRLVRNIRRTLSGRQRRTTYRWDSEDRLIEVATPDGTTWRYEYDALGRRSAKLRLGADGQVAERVGFTWDGTRIAEQESYGSDGRVHAVTWDYEPNTRRVAAQRRRSWAADAPQRDIDEAFHAIVTDLVGPYRIDVENPDPGGRPGQMHFQDQSNKSAKYYWDHQNGGFQGMPSKLANKLAGNRGYQNGIKKGLNWLGESQ